MMRVLDEEKLNTMTEYINRYVQENNGVSPGLLDIMEHMKMPKATVFRYILELEKRGIIIYKGKNTLAIKGQNELKVSFVRTAILGTIPCGEPEDCRENIQGYVAIPEEWIEGNCYLLRAKGDSMLDIGIDEDDLVLVKVVSAAYHGQVVVAMTENGTTLKRYMIDKSGRPWLFAENKTYVDEKRYIYPRYIEVQGVALKIIKDIK